MELQKSISDIAEEGHTNFNSDFMGRHIEESSLIFMPNINQQKFVDIDDINHYVAQVRKMKVNSNNQLKNQQKIRNFVKTQMKYKIKKCSFPTHYLYDKEACYNVDISGRKSQNIIKNFILVNDKNQMKINIPFSNLTQSNIISLKCNIPKNKQFQLLIPSKGLKYTLENQISTVQLQISLFCENCYKIWKQLSIPIKNDEMSFRIKEINSYQSLISLNEIQIKIQIQTPLIQQYYIFIENYLNIEILWLEIIIDLQITQNQQQQLGCQTDCFLM